MENLIGQSIGRYTLLEQLGEGGMAVVYKACDTRLERDVAVKIIRRGAFPPEQHEQILVRFEREAKALARLSHSNIVNVHDYGEYEGAPYLVMEYLPGGTLKQKMGRPIPWQAAARLLLPVARALGYAHQQGILHRDVKPSNILISETGQLMLTDFGIAKILDIEETHTLTGTGVGIGTPEYMAPEQGLGAAVDARADIYSLGVIWYELITGRKPYTADTPMAVIIKQINEPLPPPRQFAPDFPEYGERVLLKALAKQPENRYPDMRAFTAALESLSGFSTQITRQEPGQPTEEMTLDALPPLPGGIPMPEVGPKPRLHKAWLKWLPLGAAAILVCVGLMGGAVLLLGKINTAGKSTLAVGSPTRSSTLELFSPTSLPNSNISPTLIQKPSATLASNLSAGSTRVSTVDGMEMVFVPAGKFIMGDPADRAQAECLKASRDCPHDWFIDEAPPHSVDLDPYFIDETEVTNGMYALCVSAGVCDPPDSSSSRTRSSYFEDPQYDNYPVIYVTWYDAKTYCSWADRRLPSEAEWEKAARSMDERQYPWGNSAPSCTLANYYPFEREPCKGDTNEVGSYPGSKSPYGALDMAGNVWEWTADWYSEDTYSTSVKSNPLGPETGTKKILRGGAWSYLENVLRSTNRHGEVTDYSDDSSGFRCVSDFNP